MRLLPATADRQSGKRLLLSLLLILVLWPPPSAQAQFPEREPTNAEIQFGCEPGPIEPFYRDEPLPPDPLPDEGWPTGYSTLFVEGGRLGDPIWGSGFNLEHALWSCPTFRPSLRRRILEPFRPAIARVDTGLLPLAPDGVPAEQLGWSDYQALMDQPKYQPSWEFIRRLNRANVQVMLGIWGGPGAFNDDGTRRGELLPEYHDQYVEYVTAIVDYLVRVKGLSIWTITVANEPDGGDGTRIPPDDYAEVARRLGPRLAEYGVKLYGPDTASAENALWYLAYYLDDPSVMDYMGAIATHQYFPSPFVEQLVAEVQGSGYQLPLIVTEYTSFHYGELDRGDESGDEVGFMLDIATTAASLYNNGVDAALYWDAVDYYQPGHAAITAWGFLRGPADAFAPRKRYWGMLQILPYLQPGARIMQAHIQSAHDITPLAIRTPGDGRQDLAIVLINRGGPVELDLRLRELPDLSQLEVYLTDADNDLEHQGHVRLQSGSGQVYLPARSILTLAPAAAPDDLGFTEPPLD